MIVTWTTTQQRLQVRGSHKPGTPRIWSIQIHAEHDTGEMKLAKKWRIHTATPCTMIDLHDYVLAQLAEFREHVGPITYLWWQAVAR